MYNTILVPLDGSKRAEAILPHVENLAQCYNSKVIFLQVLEPIHTVVGPEGSRVTMDQLQLEGRMDEAENYLEGKRGEFREKGIEARMRLAHGPVVEAIIDAAEREGADLIAMASHGRGGLPRVFYGSVAAGVLQRVDRPLLLIRSRSAE